MEANRSSLGVAATRDHLIGKLERPDVFNTALISRRIEELEAGVGPTYFEIVLEVFAGHSNIELVAT